MKSKLLFFGFCILFFSCQKDIDTTKIIFHKSHEESRKNVPFSDAVQVGKLFYLTGQIGKNHKTGKLVEGGIQAETKQVLSNIQEVLEQHELNLSNVIKCTVILSDIKDFQEMNTIYRSFFMDNLPARTTFAANLVGDAKIEIEVVAVK